MCFRHVFQRRVSEMCFRDVCQRCVLEMCYRYVIQRCVLDMCSKNVFMILISGMCFRDIFQRCVSEMCFRDVHVCKSLFTADVQWQCQLSNNASACFYSEYVSHMPDVMDRLVSYILFEGNSSFKASIIFERAQIFQKYCSSKVDAFFQG